VDPDPGSFLQSLLRTLHPTSIFGRSNESFLFMDRQSYFHDGNYTMYKETIFIHLHTGQLWERGPRDFKDTPPKNTTKTLQKHRNTSVVQPEPEP
jgi:hypothetical protein